MRARVRKSAVVLALLLAGPLTVEAGAEAGKSVDSAKPAAAAATDSVAVAKPVAAPEKKNVAAVAPAAAKPKRIAPSLRVSISLTSQTMTVQEHGKTKHVWRISSGRKGYYTPTGSYRPQWMTRMHYSKKYDNAPMPHSVFFHKGYAIHATYATGALGRPASHGCIRLAPSNAKKFYQLVGRHGKAHTRISITGSTPKRVYAKRKKTQRKTYAVSGGSYWKPQNPAPARKYKPRKQPTAEPSYSYSYYKPKYTWPGD